VAISKNGKPTSRKQETISKPNKSMEKTTIVTFTLLFFANIPTKVVIKYRN
jgi:hypothetical protein